MTSISAISVSTESNKKLKMATQDSSPSLIIGQQWSALAELMSCSSENDEDDTDKDENKNASDSMKLGKQDMGLFGFCPARDEFSLVVCEKCNLLVKPQALKQHIESRHGPTNLSSLGNVPASALNSELGKKLLMPLPTASLTRPTTASMPMNERQASGTFKPVSSGRPPTKASLKQVPASVKNISAPLLGVSMKISPIKSVKSGNRIIPTTTASSAISNPVVKVEKLEKMPAKASSKGGKQKNTVESPPGISDNIGHTESSKISTLMNGSIKSAISLTTPSSTTTTTSPSMVSTPMLITVTKTSTDTPLSTRSVTTFVATTTKTKPLMVSPVMTIASPLSMAARPVTSTKANKPPKDQKERKFLPCKDREYDANKHCGVKVQETGKPCTRSLTCKTHALSLRRAVPGRSKSFDDLLREHKAAKDALLKAKAESQNAITTNAAAPPSRVLVSPATMSSTMGSLKQQQQLGAVLVQREGKSPHPASSPGTPRTTVPSSTVPTTTTFAKPRAGPNVFQRFSSTSQLPPAITVKEEATVRPELSARLSMSPPAEMSRSDSQDGKLDQNYLPHHPKPMALSQFGGRLNDRGCYLFSRRMDFVRAAFLSALERQLNPPPHKKLCVESNLPKESQVLSNSQDPYEFNMVDTSRAAALSLSPNLVNSSKPNLKPKSKFPTSPLAATSTNPLSLGLATTTAAAASSLSVPSHSTLCATPVAVSSVSPSGLALNWPVKSRDSVSTRSPSASPSQALPSTATTNPGKRKRSGSSGGSSGSQMVAVASGNGTMPVTPTVTTTVSTANISGGTTQNTGITGIITPTSLNSHQTGNLIAIPSVNLSSTNLSQLNAASIGTAKLNTSAGGATSGTAHKNNNIIKDFNLVLTGIDSSLVNGQYVNITGAQLAEFAANQGQTLLLNNFNPSAANTCTTSGTTASITITGSVPTSRAAKRSRSSGSKSHQTANTASKLPAALEAFKLIPSSSVITSGGLPPNAVLMDSSSLQGAMLTSVALATGGTTPTLVAISSSTANSNCTTGAGNPTQVLCTDPSSNQMVSSSTLVNGLAQSSYDKSGSNSQRHHSSSKSHHHHHHQQQHSKTPHQQQQGIALSSVLQGSSSLAVSIPSGSAAQLCSNQALFKQGGTLHLTKGVGGKLTMQPVSLTFPINVSQAGLAALTSGKPQQLQQQQQQQQQPPPTLLVATSGGGGGDVDRPAGKADLHLQSQISSSSSGNLIS